jgi:ethanolamine ammonia-lyase small subunit
VNRPDADARVEALYAHARRALYARIDDEVIRDVSPIGVRARTAAADRDDYLAHPTAGERLRDDDARAVAGTVERARPTSNSSSRMD